MKARLHDCLSDSPGTVLLSGYPSELYDELYADWHRVERKVLRQSTNGRSKPKHITEVIWINRIPTDTLW